MHFGNVSLLDLFNSSSLLDSINNSDKNLNSNETELLSSKNTFSELMFNISDLNKKTDVLCCNNIETINEDCLNNELDMDNESVSQIKLNNMKTNSSVNFIEFKSYQSNTNDIDIPNFNDSKINLGSNIDDSNLELKISKNINSMQEILNANQNTCDDNLDLELPIIDESNNLIFNLFNSPNNDEDFLDLNTINEGTNSKVNSLISNNIINKGTMLSDINANPNSTDTSISNEDTLSYNAYSKDLNKDFSDTHSLEVKDFYSNLNSVDNSTSNLNELNETFDNQDNSFSNLQNYDNDIFNQVKNGLNGLSGSKHIKLQLKPQGLGNVGINMKFINGKLELIFTVDTSTVENALMSNLSQLESILSSSGIVSINEIKIKKRNDEKSSVLFKNKYMRNEESDLLDLKINVL